MKAHIILFATVLLLVCGCSDETAQERLDAAKLQPYTNIPPGTLVLVVMRAPVKDYTHIDTSGQPRKFDFLFTNEYIFEGIDYGSAGLRKTNNTKAIYYSASMIDSITPVKK
jgi:hypothetical protein